MARRNIGTPRFYVDIPSYLKTIGKYYGSNGSNIYGSNAGEEKVWNMNPYQPNSYSLLSDKSKSSIRFWINQDPVGTSNQVHMEDPELHKLLSYINSADGHHSTGWYGGILGHNIASLQSQTGYNISIGQRFIGRQPTLTNRHYANPDNFDEIVNFESGSLLSEATGWGVAKYDGYSLWEITERGSVDDVFRYNMIDFTLINADDDEDWGENAELKVGAYTTGIFFEPPHSPDLQVKLSLESKGVNVSETVGGNTLVNIDYLGVPNWGDQPAWTLQKTEGRDYTTMANRARRVWSLSFSYISDDNLFDKANNANKFFNDSFNDGDENAHKPANFDTSMSSFFKLTQNGALPFIFCPDSKATRTETTLVEGVDVEVEVPDLEFATCILDQNSIVATQVAFQTWNISMVVREVW